MPIETISLLTNGFITLLCGIILFCIFCKLGSMGYFHLFWSLGFILYSAEIFLRAAFSTVSSTLIAVLFIFSLLLWSAGLGLILEKIFKKFLLMGSFPVTLFIIGSLIQKPMGSVLTLIAFLTMLIILTLGVFLVREKYGKIANPLLFGWVMLGTLSILFLLKLLFPPYVDLLASLAKIIIVYGVLNPNFQFIGTPVAALLKRLEANPPTTRAHFTLIKCEKVSRLKELSWIKQVILNNSSRNFKTTLITVYDSVSISELKDLELLNNGNVNVVRVLREVKERTEKTNPVTVKDDLTSLGLLISSVIKQNEKEKIPQTIIVYPLSWLILTHSWKNMYLLLSSKISELKESQTHLLAFYYPKVHNDETISYTLEKMAEQIISI